CSEARASGRRSVKNVPRNSSRMTAWMCAGFARTSRPSMTTWRSANTGWRTAHATAPHANIATAASRTTRASPFNWRGLSHMRASQDLDAKIGERDPRLFRRHRDEAVPGHSRRRVHFEELPRPVGAENQVEPAPARSADEQEGLQRLRLNRALRRVGDAARAVVARLVGKILVVVIVIALWRLDPDQRQRAIIEDRRGELDPGDELLGEHQIVVLCRRPIRDR